MPRIWPFARVAVSLLGAAAILAQLTRTVSNALEQTTGYGSHLPTVFVNFFSFFTIQSNAAAAVTLAVGAIWAWTAGRDAAREPRWLAVLLACVTTYMIVTGIVYNTLLRGIQLPQGQTVAWSNEVLHVVIPLFLLADLFFAPRRRGLGWWTVAGIAVYPIVWVVYTLVRGPLVVSPATGNAWWYPYPFLDPHNFANGYLGVSVYIVGIAVGILAVGAVVVWIGRRRARPVGR